ncbi:MAG: MEDS domain-containing protein, partial [Pseudomonadota bacterium]
MPIENDPLLTPIEVFWGEISACEHFVQIYEDDNVFMDTLEGFIRGGLLAGDAAIIIATASHLQLIEDRLEASAVDMDLFRAQDQYIALDAEKTLAEFMVNGWPDVNLFHATVNKILARARGKKGRKVRAFGANIIDCCHHVP